MTLAAAFYFFISSGLLVPGHCPDPYQLSHGSEAVTQSRPV